MRSLVFVGANIGFDVVREVTAHDFSCLIEPIPDVVRALLAEFGKEAYRDKCIQVINAACWTESGVRDFNLYNEQNGLSSSLGTVTDTAQQHYAGVDLGLIDTIQVECIRLADYMPLWLDDLIIDAQGADLEILRTIEPWLVDGRIGTIRIECDGPGFKHYDLADNSESSLLEYMGQFRYRAERDPGTVAFHPDYLFTRYSGDPLP